MFFRMLHFLVRTFGQSCNRIRDENILHDYEAPELIDVIIKKNLNYRKDLQAATSFSESELRALIYFAAIPEKPITRVVDFGGGGGNLFTVVEKLLSHRKFDWSVVETTPLCATANSTLRKANINWVNSLEILARKKANIDIVIASSSIQYTANPMQTLEQFIELTPQYIVLTKTPLLREPNPRKFFQESRLSNNGPGALPEGIRDMPIVYQITIPSMNMVEKLLQQNYEILFKVNEGSVKLRGVNTALTYYGYICKLKK